MLRSRVRINTRRDEWYTMRKKQPVWYVYIVRCSDNTLYTGITVSLDRRINEHNTSSKGAKYTRARRPVQLVASCAVASRSEAQKLECKIKSLDRSKKISYLKTYTGAKDEN